MKPVIHFRAMLYEDIGLFMRKVGYYPTNQFGGIVAYKHDTANTIMGMVGFDRWTDSGVEMHWYIDQPRCLLPLWYEAKAYLRSHGKRKIVGNTPGDNVRALRMIFGRLGFVEKARIKDGYKVGVDLVISEYDLNEHELTSTTAVVGEVKRSAA